MIEPAKKEAVYEDLYNIPENMTGQIIDGELIASPRPAPGHMNVASVLGAELVPPYRFGRGGPGGWIILMETEIMFGEHLLVPDLAGWKKERFPGWPEENWISTSPDWICEILSPSTAQTDKVRKMPIYAEYGVAHIWLIDPVIKTLDAFRNETGKWLLLASFAGEDRVRIEPFQETEIDLGDLWTE
jgi:Uma2 family endonuclease